MDSFANKLGLDEDRIDRDESKLARDEGGLGLFASKLGVDDRLAENSPLAAGTDFFSRGNSGVDSSLSPQASPPSPPDKASDFRSDLIAASGGPIPAGPVPLSRTIPQRQVDMSGMAAPSAPTLDLTNGGGRLTPLQIDQRSSGVGGLRDMNVDASGMAAAGSAAPAPAAPRSAAPLYSQARYVGAHHSDANIPYREATRKEMVRDATQMGEAVQAEHDAERAQATIHADALDQQAQDAENRRIDRMVQEAERQKFVATERSKVDTLAKDVASSKIDPNRLFGNADTGTRMALAIGGMFGGIAAAINGGENQFIKTIDGLISRDMQAQQANLTNKRGALEHARGMLGELRQDFGDQRSAELANEKAAWTSAVTQMQAQMARTTDPILKARQQQDLIAAQAKLTDLDKRFDELSFVRAQTVGGGGVKGPGLVVKLPDGRQVLAPNEKKFDELTTKSAQVTNIQSNIDRALSIRKNASAIDLVNPYSTAHKQLTALQAETAQLVTVARGQGAMSKGDQEVADSAVGSMTGILGSNDEVLKSTRTRLGEQLSRDADALGAEHVQTGYQLDANGRLQRDVALTGENDKPVPNRPKSGKPIQ